MFAQFFLRKIYVGATVFFSCVRAHELSQTTNRIVQLFHPSSNFGVAKILAHVPVRWVNSSSFSLLMTGHQAPVSELMSYPRPQTTLCSCNPLPQNPWNLALTCCYFSYQVLCTGVKGIDLFLLHSRFWHKTLTQSSCEPQTASCNILPCLLKYFCSFSLVRYWCNNFDKFGHQAHEESPTTNRIVQLHLLPSPRNLHLFRNRTMLPFCNDDEHDGI